MHSGLSASVSGALASQLNEFAGLQITFCFTSALFSGPVNDYYGCTWMSSCSHRTPAPSGQTLGLASCTQADSSCLAPSCTGFWCKSFQSLDKAEWNPVKKEEKEWTTTKWDINRMSQSRCGLSAKNKEQKKKNHTVVMLQTERTKKPPKNCTAKAVE